jgi:Peptidase family S51
MNVYWIIAYYALLLLSKSSAFPRAIPSRRSSGGHVASTSPCRPAGRFTRLRHVTDRTFRLLNLAASDQSAPHSNLNNEESSDWIMKHGMLFSSFSDGVVRNQEAHAALRRGLVGAALRRMQHDVESQVQQSVLHSPCAGPNVQLLNRLDLLDRAVSKLETCMNDPIEALHQCLCDLEEEENQWAPRKQESTTEASAKGRSVALRFVYVPTAMYALRRDSANTAGKQRQRARADAKKRRDDICDLILSLFQQDPSTHFDSSQHRIRIDVSLQVVTLDWDDGSLKQPAVWESTAGGPRASAPENLPPFPATGKQALEEWKPHLMYVQGGNTFWLHHCMDKGGWGHDVRRLVRDGATYYCGSSAGAILAGRQMEAATWKEWDDCSVVPGRDQYRDWDAVGGLGMVGPHSFFPHMTGDWQPLVDRKRMDDDRNNFVVCLRDQDVCLVDGSARALTILSSPPSADLHVVDPSIDVAAAALA